MAERTLQAKLKVRSDTATKWQSNNPVLLQGEPALETDTNKLKFGDGTSAYNDLPYISSDAVTVEANPADEATQTLEKLKVENNVYSIPQGTEVIDLGTVTLTGTEEEASGTVTVTPEQATKMKAETPPIVNFEVQGGGTYSLSRLMLVPNIGGGKDGITFAGTSASKSGEGVVAIHCTMLHVAAGSTDSTITANISTSTIYQTNEGSGVEVVDLGSVTVTTGQGTSVTVTSEQWNKIASAQHAKIKLQMLNTSIGANDPLPLELDYVTTSGDAQISVIQYQKVALWEATSSGVHQLATAMLVMINNNNTITAQFHWYISLINNGIPAGGLAGQALTKQSGTDYDVAWTSINTSEPTVMTEAAYAEALAAGTIENDKLYYIQGTSDDTLTTAAESTTYDNATSGLTATNVQDAIDELKENEFSGSYNDLTDKPTIPTTLAELSEKSYNSLTDKPTIPTLDVASIATALGLTTTQLNNLIAFAKSITSASTSGTAVNNEFTAQSFDTIA